MIENITTRYIPCRVILTHTTILSKSFFSNQWHQIDEEWATELVDLRMKVPGSWWDGCTNKEKRNLCWGIIKEYNHDKRRWFVQLDNDEVR